MLPEWISEQQQIGHLGAHKDSSLKHAGSQNGDAFKV
jgi:hypothetical protein